MGLLRRAIPIAVPVSRLGVALWVWRNRSEVLGWAGYAARSVPKLVAGDKIDVLVEGRLRSRLSADGRTRNVDGLGVSVVDGVATLSGKVSAETSDAAVDIATNTKGITRVADDLKTPKRRPTG